MPRINRRIFIGITVGTLLGGLGSVVTAEPVAARSHAATGVVRSVGPRVATPLDGFVITHLPGGLGSLESSFEYEWGEVTFHSRVWESGPDPDGGYRVDLTVKTLRGPSLTDLEAVRTFLTDYYEYDADRWKLTPIRIGRYPGYLARDRAFWFVAPGVAAAVTIDRDRFARSDLVATARGFRPKCDEHPS